jgi:hypothetical protein
VSAWTDLEWEGFCALLEEAWPGDFDEVARSSWRVLLDGIEPAAASEGLRRMLFSGQRFRPSVSELIAAVREDPSTPTFEEAYQLIFGSGGVLKARAPHKALITEDDERRAVQERLETVHPLVASFATRQGLSRLGSLPLEDPVWGEKHRKDLEQAWVNHCESQEHREVAALAAGGGPKQLDPFQALLQIDRA